MLSFVKSSVLLPIFQPLHLIHSQSPAFIFSFHRRRHHFTTPLSCLLDVRVCIIACSRIIYICNSRDHISSFIHSGYLYSASSGPLLLRGAPDTARIMCLSFTRKRHRQLRVKDLSKVSTWRLEPDSNPRPSGQQLLTLPMSHHVSQCSM